MQRIAGSSKWLAVSVIVTAVLLIVLSPWLVPQAPASNAIAVVRVGPAAGAKAVALNTPITLEFSGPVIDEALLEQVADDPRRQQELPQPIVLADQAAPAIPVPGDGHWLTPSIYSFAPANGLRAATSYQAMLRPNLSLVRGAHITTSPPWHFTTTSPLLAGTRPFNGATDVPIDSSVSVFLDAQVDVAEAMQRFQLMNQSSGKPVAGKAQPIQGGFVFRPATPLAVGTIFQARLRPGIRTTNGANLEYQPLAWRFTTLRSLEVTAVSPAADQANVSLTTGLRVNFSRPVVELPFDDVQLGLPQPLQITPPLPGAGRWVAPDDYVFTPTGTLQPATSYVVEIAPSLTDSAGVTLQRPYSWRFKTTQPVPLLFTNSSVDGLTTILPDAHPSVGFNQPIALASAQQRVSLRKDTGELVDGSISVVGTTAAFTPTAPLARGQSYRLIVAPGVQPVAAGAALQQGAVYSFTVVGPPTLIRAYSKPAEGASDVVAGSVAFGGSGIRLTFNAPMDWDSVLGSLTIDPPARRLFVEKQDTTLALDPELAADTSYRVSIGAAALDRFGFALGHDEVLTFRTGSLKALPPSVEIATRLEPGNGSRPYQPASASISIPDGYAVGTYSFYDPARIALRYVNTAQVRYQIYKLGQDQVMTALAKTEPVTLDGPPLREETVALSGGPEQQQLYVLNLGTLDPGLYQLVVRNPANNKSDFQMMAVSRYALTIKRSADQLFVWAVDLKTGAPVADLPLTASYYVDRVAGAGIVARGLGRTNRDGVVQTSLTAMQIDLPEGGLAARGQLFITGGSDDRFAFASTTWERDISPQSFGLPIGNAKISVIGNVYTDRPLYRPGQLVFMRGMVRIDLDRVYQLPRTGQRMRIQVNDSRGNTVLSQFVPLNTTGSFSSSLQLDRVAPSGSYTIFCTLEGERLSVGAGGSTAEETPIPPHHILGSFVVAEYRKPTFEVTVTPEEASLVPNQRASFTITARDFAGEPVADAQVAWYVARMPIDAPASLSSGFRFGQSEAAAAVIVTERKSGATDAQGRLTIEQYIDTIPTGQRLVLHVEVYDVGRQSSSFGQAIINPSDDTFLIGVRPSRFVTRPGEPVNVELQVVRPNNQPVASQPITVTVFRRDRFSAQQQGSDGRFYWESIDKDVLIATQGVTTTRTGSARIGLPRLRGGTYRIVAAGRDSAGNEVSSSVLMYVYGDDAFWGIDNTNQLRLLADRDRYRPGEVATLLVPAPYRGMTALLTIERGAVLEYRTFVITSTTGLIRLPIVAEHTPNIFVSVVLIKAAGNDTPIPDLRVGMIELEVPIEEQTLNVKVTPERPQARPGDPAALTIKVTDKDGRGVRAELAVAVVDKAVLALYRSALSGDPTPTYTEGLFGRRDLGVATANTLVQLVDRVTLRVLPGSKGGGGGLGLTDERLARRNFVDTLYWNPSLMTDDTGIAHVLVSRLPDNLTTWSVAARAITADTRFGQDIAAEIVVSKPLSVRPQLPARLAVGDRAVVRALVRNNTVFTVTANVTLDAIGLGLATPQEQQVVLPPCPKDVATFAGGGAQGSVCEHGLGWSLVANDEGQATLQFSLHTDEAALPSADRTDIVSSTLEVQRYAGPDVVLGYGQVAADDTATITVPGVSTPAPTKAAVRRELIVDLSPSPAAAIDAGLHALAAQPYLDTEQTVSGWLPQLAAAQAGRLNDDSRRQLDAQAPTRLQRLYQLQNLDGGWGWASGDRVSDPYISAYVLQSFVAARAVGYAVDDPTLERAVDYLRGALNDSTLGTVPAEPWRGNTRSYVLYALTLAGRTDVGRTLALYDQRSQLGAYGRAYLLMTLQAVGGQQEQVALVAAELAAAAVPRRDDVYWADTTDDAATMSSDTRTTALVVQALTRANLSTPLLPNSIRYLLSSRLGALWATTQESAVALLALLDATRIDDVSYDYQATLPNRTLLKGSIEGVAAAQMLSATAALEAGITNTLKITRPSRWLWIGKGNLYYQVRMRSYYDAAAVEPIDQGLALSRSYMAVDPTTLRSTNRRISEAVRGDLVLVRLQIVVPEATRFLAVTDPLPAGLEPLDILPRAGEALVDASPDTSRSPTDQGAFSHVELYQDHIALYASTLSPGTYTYTYVARATTVGAFAAPPASTYRVYAPHIFGRTAGGRFIVRESVPAMATPT